MVDEGYGGHAKLLFEHGVKIGGGHIGNVSQNGDGKRFCEMLRHIDYSLGNAVAIRKLYGDGMRH